MRYFPILQELFESDTVLFFLFGAAAAMALGARRKEKKKLWADAGIAAGLYLVCELLSNTHTNFMLELVLLFFGTVALGCVLGFVICLLAGAVRKNGRSDGGK